MDANPYLPPGTSSGLPADVGHSRWLRHSFFAAFAAFGVSYLLVSVGLSIAWHGHVVGFPIYDTAHPVLAMIAALHAGALFAAASTYRFTRSRWIPPVTFLVLIGTLTSFFYAFGFPGTGRGAINLSPFCCGCLLAISPLLACFSLLRFSSKRMAVAMLPYLCSLILVTYATLAS